MGRREEVNIEKQSVDVAWYDNQSEGVGNQGMPSALSVVGFWLISSGGRMSCLLLRSGDGCSGQRHVAGSRVY